MKLPVQLQSKLVMGTWLVLLMAYVIAGLWFVPFHGDESTQTYMSRDFAYTFLERDLSKVFYASQPISPQEQELRIINGTINKYTIGLAWFTTGFHVDDINEQWDWGAPYDYNIETGHQPGERMLPIVRLPSTLFTAAGVIVIFMLGWHLGGMPTAYMASLFYAINPIVLVNGRRAMMEGSMMFGTLLVALAGVYVLQSAQRWRAEILLGLAAAFALATKHTNLFAVGAVFLACFTYLLWQRGRFRQLLPLLVAGIVTIIVFFALNPAWWVNPIGTANAILDARTNLLRIQTDVFGSYESVATQLGGFWWQVIVGKAMYYEVPRWDAYIGDQIAQYERWLLGGYHVPGIITAGLLVIGFAALWLQKGRDNLVARWVIGWWAALVTLAMLLLTPLEWQRYYLPAVPGLMLIVGYGAATLVSFLLTNLRIPQHQRERTDPNTNTQ